MKLKRKGIKLDTRCPVCFRLDEDGGHCFLKCKSVKALWRAMELEQIRIELESCPNAKWVMIQILNKKENICIKICTLLWTWWLERNRANQGQQVRNLNQILHSWQFHLLDYKQHLKKEKGKKQKSEQIWSSPPKDFLKVNLDGAFRKENQLGGWGFIISNERGEKLVAGAGKLDNIADPLQAEAMAMYNAIWEAERMGCRKIILETDASNLKQAVCTKDYDNSALGMLFKDIKARIRMSFQCCKINVISRDCNKVAHCLAGYGVRQGKGYYQVWLKPFPSFVQNFVAGSSPACVV